METYFDYSVKRRITSTKNDKTVCSDFVQAQFIQFNNYRLIL